MTPPSQFHFEDRPFFIAWGDWRILVALRSSPPHISSDLPPHNPPIPSPAISNEWSISFSYIFFHFFSVTQARQCQCINLDHSLWRSDFLVLFYPFHSILAFFFLLISIFQDSSKNPEEFPKSFLQGTPEGIWWTFITMTTVG